MTSAQPEDDHRSIEVMRREIATIPDVLAAQREALRAPLRDLVARLALDRADQPEIILTGCGDSYFAALATKLVFERYAGVRCRAVEALELARYEVRYVPAEPPPVLVAISYSGEVGRTIEAATAAGEAGWRTVALTGRAQGRLAGTVAETVLMDVPTLGFSPGTSTYVAMLVALCLLAGEIAAVAGRPTQAAAVSDALARAPDLARATLAAAEAPARRAGERWADATTTTFLGAGPSRASAAFAAAKLFEGPQRYGVAQDLEEWAHEQYFVSGPGTPVVVVAPAGASFDRAQELLAEMAFIGAPATLVTDAPPRESVPAHDELRWAGGLDEPFSPLLSCLPLALATFFLAARLGTRSYGFPSPEREREHYETIHRATRGQPA